MGRVTKWASGTVAGTTQITGVPTTVTTNGNSDTINLGHASRILASVTVGTPTGTSPTLDVVVETLDPIGHWLPVATLTKLTAAAFTYAPTGPGTANTYVLGNEIRFRWTIGGTDTPTFPAFAVAVIGR